MHSSEKGSPLEEGALKKKNEEVDLKNAKIWGSLAIPEMRHLYLYLYLSSVSLFVFYRGQGTWLADGSAGDCLRFGECCTAVAGGPPSLPPSYSPPPPSPLPLPSLIRVQHPPSLPGTSPSQWGSTLLRTFFWDFYLTVDYEISYHAQCQVWLKGRKNLNLKIVCLELNLPVVLPCSGSS